MRIMSYEDSEIKPRKRGGTQRRSRPPERSEIGFGDVVHPQAIHARALQHGTDIGSDRTVASLR
jgi:hypothetical protein